MGKAGRPRLIAAAQPRPFRTRAFLTGCVGPLLLAATLWPAPDLSAQQAAAPADTGISSAATGSADDGSAPSAPADLSAAEAPSAPRSVDALYREGQAAARRADVAGAQRLYEAVLLRAPYHALTHMALGRLHLERAPQRAREHLETAARLLPSAPDVHYLLGQALEALRLPVDAAEAYRRAIHLDPRHYDANARLRQMLRRLRSSRTVVERAAESFYAQPNLATLTLFGRIVMEHMQPREAVLEFEELRRRQPELAEGELWLARARHAAGDVEGELTAYRRYLEAQPAASGVRLLLVERMAGQGWYRDAAGLLQPFLDGEAGARTLAPSTRARVTFLDSRLRIALGNPAQAGELLLRAHAQGHAAEEIRRAFAEDLALFGDEVPALWLSYGTWLREMRQPAEAADALAQAGRLDAGLRSQARTALQAMQTNAGATVATALALGELAWAEGDGAQALARLEAVPAGHALDPRAALLRGKIFRAQGNADAALDAFTRYVFSHEDRRDVLYARGNLFWELGQRDEALAVWRRDPDVLLSHPQVLVRVAEHYRAHGDAPAELAVRERLARAVPSHRASRIRLGELYAQRGWNAEAVRVWEGVLAEQPRNGELLARTGATWLALGKPERALPLLQRASQMQALDSEASLLLARELYRAQQYEAALRAYWTLYETQPDHPDLPRVLPELVLSVPASMDQRWVAARLAHRAANRTTAAELLEALLAQQPQRTEVRLLLARVYVELERTHDAESVLTAAGGGSGESEQGLQLLADVQARTGRRDLLAITLARLHALRPDDADLLQRRALLLAELERYTEAGPLLQRALANAPQDPAVHLALAHAALAVKDIASAERHLDAVPEGGVQYADAQQRLIGLLLAAERWNDAAERLEAWVAARPADATARYNLITVYLKEFRTDRARPHFEALERFDARRARSLAPYFR